ncbi:MAG: hypothetical protein V1809_08065 [Planctomycetota bacterium]
MTEPPSSRQSGIYRQIQRDARRPDAEIFSFIFGENREWQGLAANTRELREAAWRLVQEFYVRKGYMAPGGPGMRIIPQDALPETTTYLAIQAATGQTAATLTLVPDSPLGLPMDDLYRADLDVLRASGRKPAEIAKLVAGLDDTDERLGMEMLLHLFKLAYLTARRLEGCTDLVITVNPRHQKYYRRLLRFEYVGETRRYASVAGAEAVPLRLDLLTAEETIRKRFTDHPSAQNLYRFFVENPDIPDILAWLRKERTPMPPGDLRYFFREKTDLLDRMSASARIYLKGCYPDLKL